MDGFAAINNNQEVIGFLGEIQGICCQFDDQCQWVYVINQEKMRVDFFIQKKFIATYVFHDELKALVDVLESYGGTYEKDQGLNKSEIAAMNMADPGNDD